MKKNLYTLLLLSIVSLSNCKKKDYDNSPQPGPEKGKTTVQSYDKITLNGDFVLHIHHSPERRGEITIRPGKYDGSKVDYKSEGGELVYT